MTYGFHGTATVRLDDLQTLVAGEFNVDPRMFWKHNRKKRFVRPRQVAMYLAREQRYTFKEIGGFFGGRHHTTALHAHQSIPDYMQADPALAARVENLRNKIIAFAKPTTEI